MSLGIAKIIDGEIHIHADSLMTGSDVVSHDLQKHSVLKAVLVNHQFCIVFAGNIEVADDLLKKVHECIPFSFNRLFHFMLQHHKRHNLGTDYIIASTVNNHPLLFEIKDGRINSNIQSSWVGSKNAFACFQEHFEECKSEGRKIPDAFQTAFGRVIDDERVPEVGGFRFSINQFCDEKLNGKPFFLNYDCCIHLYTSVDENFKKKYGFWDSRMASVADGTFAYTSLPSYTFKSPGVGLYFGHVKLGLMFSYKHFGLYPQQYRNCSSLEFADEVSKIDIELRGDAYETNGTVQILAKKPKKNLE